MKKIVLILGTLAISASMMAQQKGEVSLTGTLLLSSGNTVVATNIDGQTTTATTSNPVSFDFGAGVGVFVANNVELGIGLYYGLDRHKNEHSTSENFYYDSSSSFTIKPELAYYVPLVTRKFFWTPTLEMGFGFNSTKSQINRETITTVKDPSLFTIGVDVLAFECRPWKHLAFDFSLGGLFYRRSSSKEVTELASVKTITHDVTFGFSNYFSPSIGVKYIF